MSSKNSILLLTSVALGAAGTWGALAALAPARVLGEAYRIFFFEFPSALLATGLFTLTLAAGLLYLRTRSLRWDGVAEGSARLGLLFCTITLLTGVLFARETWYEHQNLYWTWDPIETSTLSMWFVYAGLLTLRRAVEEPEARARLSAVLGVFGYVSVPMTYLSTRIAGFSLHPTSASIGLEPPMWGVAVLMVASLAGFSMAALRWEWQASGGRG
ncbi:MAG: cytochrome c biogenesis protein CcsA [Euryarchaeota archaeon]|nr:cytochrome c biogenesis protein CcsA [Euryarchaeota archaeon]